ncbi:Holliday junction DNA helicase RuvA [candidate division WOR-1 bacterium RIFOXYA12_FULL_43_27]|uniref:Putative pre-16S rRNA nuclease n=1 Tax=candidate division WOR-1 bacterium RIFOXYC2_FULL_46_14 TaxID=1802587 RepID=A0A1F4U3Q7_UNCSA|nr:MAG: Holliday junction DNA helicase RuvA [candidate division WOR-1 bacterium RIFOXYA12_FULL_43_27]OGC20098.1 MAG: Holliday junction DNA helicase RuvA [candidate division WOR-1 bacterium RIFOXYB2_FULL_46_45]OGC32166.1 MAG: Holliday junction DNA helicase RuvA [candidate division WOR-1 bacterium RIFOXYA2_FULL_46_56]OGC39566.1 MAG: Holliday junction DNA helicase RuvA [candidate division WOR-1 bacterium RIFOXYC2_FULL_46_14]
MRILAIDYGEKRVGVAVSDPLGFTAQPVGTIGPNIEEIKKIIERYEEVSEIVVGLPKTMRGEIGPRAQKTLEFVDLLKKEINIPIVTWDERLTTSDARRTLHEAGLNEKKQRKVIDQLAAVLILEGYLQRKNK